MSSGLGEELVSSKDFIRRDVPFCTEYESASHEYTTENPAGFDFFFPHLVDSVRSES